MIVTHHEQPVDFEPTDEQQNIEKRPSKTPIQRTAGAILFFLKDQWFLVAIAVVIIIASQL